MVKTKIISTLVTLLMFSAMVTFTEGTTDASTKELMLVTCQSFAPNLSIDPTSYDFGDITIGDTRVTTFEIWNSACCTLQYSLVENCSWLTVEPLMGTSYGEHDLITITLETNTMDPGFYHQDIQILSNGDNKNFSISVHTIKADSPKITLSPRDYNFGNEIKGSTPSTNFEVWNCGIGTLSYSLFNIPSWIDVTPMNGTSIGDHDIIHITVITSMLTTGPHTGYVHLTSNGGEISFMFTVNVRNPSPELSYSPHSYHFGYRTPGETDLTTFQIWNSGIDKLTYYFEENCDWITIDPVYGLSAGEQDTIDVRIDTTGLTERSNIYNITINTNAGLGYFTVIVMIGEGYTNITVSEAWDLLTNTSNGIQIPIDVRYDNEWAVGHIDTPAPENPRHHCHCVLSTDDIILQSFIALYQGQEIILYSLEGRRSLATANLLLDHNFTGTIYNMPGGINAWTIAGYPTKPNTPPEKPTIIGEAKGKPGEAYPYNITALDSDGDNLYYYINWSDNTTNQLIGPYESDNIVTLLHTWSEKGTYLVKVKARDIYGAESDYATLQVKMPTIFISNALYELLFRILHIFFPEFRYYFS